MSYEFFNSKCKTNGDCYKLRFSYEQRSNELITHNSQFITIFVFHLTLLKHILPTSYSQQAY